MSHSIENERLTRRELLAMLAAGAAAVPLFQPNAATAGQTVVPAMPFPFKLGIQSYSLRNFGLDDALAKTSSLGIKWWEGFPAHVPITEDAGKIAGYKTALARHGVKMISYGVLDFTTDEGDARKKFEFAKAMGIRTLTASPAPEALPMLDKLTQEFAINIGIHNHGKGDARWGDWKTIEDAIQGLNIRMGACDDTGHYLMADKNPITAANTFGNRLYSIHLKNVGVGPGQTKHFEPIGVTGGLFDVVQLLRFLKEHKYEHIMAIEEEDHPDNPMPAIRESVTAMRRFIKTVNTIMLKQG